MNKRIIFHVDVNNAFLSWTAVELLNNGYEIDIRTISSVIGGDEESRHGIVLAKSPVAKKKGVVTAETLYMARKKCPDLKVFPGNMSMYKEMSDKLYNYLLKYTPDVERASIDECYMDMTNTTFLYKNVIDCAYKINKEVKEKFGFTVNVGIGNNKLCAKMASDFEKPDKVHTLFKEEIETKLWLLPVTELFMVGRKTALKLKELKINTIGELANTNIDFLKKHFKSFANVIWEFANGIDESNVETESAKSKSISASWTLPKDTDDINELKKIIRAQSDEVGRTLRKQNEYATVIAVTFKDSNFTNYSKQMKIQNATNLSEEIYKYTEEILIKAWNNEKIRNIGIRISGFTTKREEQISIFDKPRNIKDDKLQHTIDKINDKYKKSTIIAASLLKK